MGSYHPVLGGYFFRRLQRAPNRDFFDLWLACHMQEEIAEAVG